MINYSIIIPHKNIPHLLSKCVESIPLRDDIQIIIVDDSSDPSIVDFNFFPGLGKKNTEVLFTKEGRGAGYVRNQGLKLAKGKWVLFADADDFFVDNFLSILDKYLNSTADIVYFFTDSIHIEKATSSNRHLFTNKILSHYLSGDKHGENMVRYTLLGPCSKMFARSFIFQHNIQFDEVPVMNDTIFALTAGILAKKIDVESNIIYIITERSNSLIYSKSIDLMLARIDVSLRANEMYALINRKEYKYNILALIYSARIYGYKGILRSLAHCKSKLSVFKLIRLLTIDFYKWVCVKFNKNSIYAIRN